MSMRQRLSLVFALLLLPAGASAHIDLLEPQPRAQGNFRFDDDPNSNLKEGPCGQVENGRTDRVTALRGGQTLTVRFDEWISHTSYYRLALDVDGDDDFPLRGAPAVLSPEGDDPESLFPVDGVRILAFELNDRRGGEYTMEVTVPNLDCDNCTLQLIQYMYASMRPYYFQCADITIEADPELPPSPAPETLPPWDLEAAQNSRFDPDAGFVLPPYPRRPRTESDAGAPLAEAVRDAGVAESPRRRGGCSFAPTPKPSGAQLPLLALVALALGGWRVRRQPHHGLVLATGKNSTHHRWLSRSRSGHRSRAG